MPRRQKVEVSHKMRRLVERAVQLHVKKATTIFLPNNGDWSRVKKDRDALHRSARIAKQKLLEEIGRIEGFLEAHRELRKSSLR